jgi:PAS domain-containing protein
MRKSNSVPVLNLVGHLVANAVIELVGTAMDITERKHVEDKIREQEAELRQILDATPQHLIPEFVVVLASGASTSSDVPLVTAGKQRAGWRPQTSELSTFASAVVEANVKHRPTSSCQAASPYQTA